MPENQKHGARLRLRLTDDDNRIFSVKSTAGRVIGHAVDGLGEGPRLLVAGTGDNAELVFQKILRLPALRSLKGGLVFLCMDRLDHAGDLVELDRLAAIMGPIKDTFFLSAVALNDADRGAAQTEELFRAVLRFCAKHGMDLSDNPPADQVSRDRAQ